MIVGQRKTCSWCTIEQGIKSRLRLLYGSQFTYKKDEVSKRSIVKNKNPNSSEKKKSYIPVLELI